MDRAAAGGPLQRRPHGRRHRHGQGPAIGGGIGAEPAPATHHPAALAGPLQQGLAAGGVGNVFGSFLQGALRNPAAADSQQGRLFIGFAAAELLGLLAFVVAMILIFVA